MRAVAFSLAATAVVVIACAWACLPELEIAPPGAVGPYCGDGVITPDAGETCDPGPDASPDARAACGGCKVACTGGNAFIDGVSNHCYYSVSTETMGDAGASCESSGAHLVRFVSESEVSLVAHFAGETYWVGLDDLESAGTWFPSEPTNEPGWTMQCPGCFAHIAGANDIPLLPSDAGLSHHCVEGYVASGEDGGVVPPWMQVFCVDKSLALCEREPLGTRTVSCPQQGAACFTVAQTQSTKRYVLVGLTTADGAVQACSDLGGGLVVFQTREEREQVGYEIGTETVVDGGANEFWIGLSASDAGAWSWDRDAGGLEPPPWALNQPPPTPIIPSARAYVLVAAGTIDSELARTQTSLAETHYAVCEIP